MLENVPSSELAAMAQALSEATGSRHPSEYRVLQDLIAYCEARALYHAIGAEQTKRMESARGTQKRRRRS